MLRKIMIRNINTAVKKTLPFIGYLTSPAFGAITRPAFFKYVFAQPNLKAHTD